MCPSPLQHFLIKVSGASSFSTGSPLLREFLGVRERFTLLDISWDISRIKDLLTYSSNVG